MTAEWFDTFYGLDAINVGRILAGQTLDIGGRTVKIDYVSEVIVGIDSDGLFVGVTVKDTYGVPWTLYNDGTVTDIDDNDVGRHAFRTQPVVDDAPNPLRDLAEGLARMQFGVAR